MTIKYGYFKQPLFWELVSITNDLIVNALTQMD